MRTAQPHAKPATRPEVLRGHTFLDNGIKYIWSFQHIWGYRNLDTINH